MKIIYMGTPDFAVYPLNRLVESGYEIVAVVTNPDKPAGRGQKLQESAVKIYARGKGFRIFQPEKFRNEAFLEALKGLNADLNIVVAFKMLPEEVWGMPHLGTMNLHASLLPDYRGAAPINRVIMEGEKKTGVSTFLLNHGMDTGKVLLRKEVEIGADMTAGELHDKLMETGGELLVESVKLLESGAYSLIDQETLLQGREAKYAPKIFKDDMKIDWGKELHEIYDHIRGLSPFPGAWTELKNIHTGEIMVLKIFKVEKIVSVNGRKPGLYSDGKALIAVEVRGGKIVIKELQLSGKKRMTTEAFLRGFRMEDYQLNGAWN